MSKASADLFGALQRTATFSGEDNCYRDELRRVWNAGMPLLVVCMLNPSHASHEIDDQTVLALMHFGREWGYGGLLIVNLYSWRSPSPKLMKANDARVGPNNGQALEDAMAYARDNGGKLLVAWGADGNFEGRADWFVSRATRIYGLLLVCLGKTRGGDPKHPMARGKHRIPRDLRPVIWRRALP